METVHKGLQASDLILITSIGILGYFIMMGFGVMLFRMFFPAIKIQEPSAVNGEMRIIKAEVQPRNSMRVRKMRLAQ